MHTKESIKQLIPSLRADYKALSAETKTLLVSLEFCLGSIIFDILSSIPHTEGFSEQNGFARHANGEFWLKHALIQNSCDVLAYALFSYVLYRMGALINRKASFLAACAPWFYLGYLHFDAAYHNLMLHFGLYVESDMFTQMLGGMFK